MVELKPLIVVTGAVHVEGGEQNRVRDEESIRAGNRMTIVVDRKVSPDRRAANVIATDFVRRLKGIALIRTPFGVLISPKRLDDLKAIIAQSNRKIAEFNSTKRSVKLTDCVLWEPLDGKRRHAVAGWLAAKKAEKNAVVLAALNEVAA